MRVCVIFGAGDSAGVHARGPRKAEFQPPVTSQLFEDRPSFVKLLGAYPGARSLAEHLATIGETRTLEEELETLSLATAGTRDHEYFPQIAAYIRDLVTMTAKSYIESGGNYHVLAQRLLRKEDWESLVVTANYDDLFERGMAEWEPELAINRFEDYAAEDRAIKIVKPHGSTNCSARSRS